MNWIRKHFKQIIYISFLFPILLVAFVSISHVTAWYGIANPLSWAIYLSVAVEVAALSSLAAIVAKMGKKVFFPFGIVTLIQFIGNIFFSYQYIDINSQMFKDWVDLVSPLVTFMGIEPTDMIGHKRLLSFLTGGMLPIISLTFLGLLVRFEEEDWDKKDDVPTPKDEPNPEQVIDAKDLMSEVTRIHPSEDELSKLEEVLKNKTYRPPSIANEPGEIPENSKEPDEIPENPKEIEIIEDKDAVQKEWVPALGDEEIREMVLDEYDRKYDMKDDDYDLLVNTESVAEEPVAEETSPEPIPLPVTPTPEPIEENKITPQDDIPFIPEVTDYIPPQQDEVKKK